MDIVCTTVGAAGGETFQATSLHTPYGVDVPRADVSTCQRFGRGVGMLRLWGFGTPGGVETMWTSSLQLLGATVVVGLLHGKVRLWVSWG